MPSKFLYVLHKSQWTRSSSIFPVFSCISCHGLSYWVPNQLEVH
jgi:hypothetical protein